MDNDTLISAISNLQNQGVTSPQRVGFFEGGWRQDTDKPHLPTASDKLPNIIKGLCLLDGLAVGVAEILQGFSSTAPHKRNRSDLIGWFRKVEDKLRCVLPR